jgi:predicted metal-dependent hydrolase
MTALHNINFGGEEIAFSVEHTRRRKTMAISVGFEGVRVLAPADLDDRHVSEFVRKKGAWVLQKQAVYRELGGMPVVREFVSGETFHYLGRAYRLKVVSDRRPRPTSARGRSLIVPVLPKLDPAIRRTSVRESLRLWYRRHAVQQFSLRSGAIAIRLGITAPSIKVVDQTKRWGSCSPDGCIRLNWRLVMAPMALVDYVVAHELCHLIEHNHSRRFWRALEIVMPDFEQRVRKLDRTGHLFVW